jgi:hypothetical protein
MDKCCRPLYYQLLFTLMLSFLNLLLMFLISFCPHFFQILFGLELEFWKHSKKKKLGERHMEFQKKAFELLLKGQELVNQAVHRCGCGGLDTTGWFFLFPSCLNFSFDRDDRHLRYYEDRTTCSAKWSLGANMMF